jgi:hypothetical protein
MPHAAQALDLPKWGPEQLEVPALAQRQGTEERCFPLHCLVDDRLGSLNRLGLAMRQPVG